VPNSNRVLTISYGGTDEIREIVTRQNDEIWAATGSVLAAGSGSDVGRKKKGNGGLNLNFEFELSCRSPGG
jgi:hypothetical protein